MRRVRTTIPVHVKQAFITEQLYLLMCLDLGWIIHDPEDRNAPDMRQQCKRILMSKDNVEIRFELRKWLSDREIV